MNTITRIKRHKAIKNDSALKQSLLIGLGLVDLTREKVEKYLSGLKKDLPENARKKAANDFVRSIKSNSKNLEHSTRKHIKSVLDQMSLTINPDK
ncbi:MAG: hypothetical protein UV88_C0002G0030 [Parcubacteria group bacterium GW2011_GWA1_43_21]|uniref:Uncharacterized protein n=1 Tax=Candidatus Vogelbacteria bacterium RIFOXYB1_FULL_42_16 TaxID=1802436 RepID=A0A1G2QC56_9BACT|nr:MAG: hypothetical protein UV88_C0002G0030 [Parcubacteria group bacterium GW2011_GWA1_43_21]OHA58067.1 MAG: hypothetical protein A2370_01760 [Candidatus Vogelbacteria bacterium RIFOXYB1_FULL_42_16]